MTLTAGTKLGPYEILAPIGAGGMGEVYRAKDTRLGRDVAVKVLPAALSSSAELRQRLEREAKTISQLSHAHICTLYDVGHQDGTDYLVMEFLEGETLADRLGKGAIPTDQALRIGIEILGALDAAHRQGIVHRDLKPGNIMLTKSGVKLLDFGLAKLAAAPPETAVSQATSLPTALQQSQPLTTRGTILGTFQYMAPEQLEGRDADGRSDIFAFGCVLYEMLTGKKAFTGASQASLIGSIMNTDPAPISSIQPMIPASLDRIVKGCLAKEPEHRWSTAHDVMLQLQWIAEGGSQAGVPAPVVARRKNREKVAWGLLAAALVAAAALAVGYVQRAPKPAPLVRFDIVPAVDIATMDVPRISPDGKLLAFDATDMEGKARIWVRPLSSLTAQPLMGTEGGVRPFWSPDSRYVAFIADGVLKKVDVSGGPPTKVCDAPGGSDGTWSQEGVILFDGTGTDPIYRVSASGGTKSVAVVQDPAKKETTVGWPQFLPDGKHYIYLVTGEKPEDSAYWIASIDSAEKTKLAPAQTLVEYAPPGYLLFVRDRTLVAQCRSPRRSAPTTSASHASRSRTTACWPIARGRPGGACCGGTGRARRSTSSPTPGTTRTRPCRPPAIASRTASPIRAASRTTSGSGTSPGASTRDSRSARATTTGRSGRPTARRLCSPPTARDPSTSMRSRRRERARRSCSSTATSPSRRRAGRATGSTSRSRAGTPRRSGTCGRSR
jgi:eukaryotic-like serine/threonine-protein kinase